MKTLLDVSRGSRLVLAENGKPFVGVIVASRLGSENDPTRATITIQTSDRVAAGAQLTIPGLPETGGCGRAEPVQNGEIQVLDVLIAYDCIDLKTVTG
jgi:hypothetical protein